MSPLRVELFRFRFITQSKLNTSISHIRSSSRSSLFQYRDIINMISIRVCVVLLSLTVCRGQIINPFLNQGSSFLDFNVLNFFNPPKPGSGLKRIKLVEPIITGRFLLKHYQYDGLEDVLKAQGLSEDAIRTIRDASVVVSVSLKENDLSNENMNDNFDYYAEPEVQTRRGSNASVEKAEEITITTEDGNNDDSITLIPGTEINITNPINRELTSVRSVILSPTMIRTLSEGLRSGNIEIKTWSFHPTGVNLKTEVIKKNNLFPTVGNQIYVRVDERNNPKQLKLGWI
ncbi:uncharacterized protein LOC111700853 [Eurytemora carolleeae]|uniref:uncharacterized protein LOC111700853 n=1 Tax=Eurytemora carolleeae TaxID=1294199 RepID=UPI000C77CEFA|nr:uncharacterized protein LOC111700853 [Eurytemora carolleeae]|eukprot:XP_023327679.1 uncharacterized protein LOC111700853 [Eurytemora affinis]